MLSFLSPLFLAGAAAAAIPIALHLLRREPEARIKFPAVKLLREAPVERTHRRRLRELLLLALRVTALVLLALAFARPYFAHGATLGSRGVTMIALDTSYSMSAPGRFERARALAREAVRRAPASDAVGLLTFSDQADMAAAPTGDRELVDSAIERAQPGFGGTRYRAGLNAAVQALDGRRGTIVVVTDLQEIGWDAGDRAAVPDHTRVEVVDIGSIPPNLAITGLRLASDRVVATVHNTGTSRQARISLALDGRPAGDVTAEIPAGGSTDVTLAPRGGAAAASVSIEDPTGLQADNTRFAVFDGSGRPHVLLVTSTGQSTGDAFYVAAALSAAGSTGTSFEVTAVSGAQLSTWEPSRLDSELAVIVLSTRGLERRGREALARYVQRGGGLLIAASPDVDGEVVSDVLGADVPLRIAAEQDPKPALRTLAPADVRHPVFGAFDTGAPALGLVRFRAVARIGGRGCQTVARFTTNEPAMLDCGAGEGRGLVFASDLGNRWNDFPLHATYVPFLHEIVRYLSAGRRVAKDYLVGEQGMPPAPGIVRIPAAAGKGPARQVAVNVDPRESEPGRISIEEFQSAVTRLRAAAEADARVDASQQEDRQHLWQYVFIAMVLVLGVEGLVASRTA